MQRPLLEWVFSKTAGMSPELEEIWMEWYDYHQLMMCRMPGWTWNYRLMNLIGPEKYVSLYRVEDYEALKLIEGWPRVDQGKMDPITDNIDPAALQDWEDKVRRGLQDTGKFTFTGGATDQNPLDQGHWGWRYLAGAALDDPLLKSNRSPRHGADQRVAGERRAVEGVVRRGAVPGLGEAARRRHGGLVRHHDRGARVRAGVQLHQPSSSSKARTTRSGSATPTRESPKPRRSGKTRRRSRTTP